MKEKIDQIEEGLEDIVVKFDRSINEFELFKQQFISKATEKTVSNGFSLSVLKFEFKNLSVSNEFYCIYINDLTNKQLFILAGNLFEKNM